MYRIPLICSLLFALACTQSQSSTPQNESKTGDQATLSKENKAAGKKDNTAATGKAKLSRSDAEKAAQKMPGMRETFAERADRIRANLGDDNPALRLFPKGEADPASGGKPLPDKKRECVDHCFNGLDVEKVCEGRVPPKTEKRQEALAKCHSGARRFCGDKCRVIPRQPTRQRPLPEPKAVTKADVGARLGIKPGQKLYVTIITNMGTMIGELFWEKAPNTVTNFVELAEGKRGFIDPKLDPSLAVEKRTVKRPYYDGLIFHRVIPNFMIQGGDIAGTGGGGPGYTFGDEFDPSLRHDKPGVFSMANAGPGTNGSQFFITERPTTNLDDRHSVFGQLIEGLEIQSKIARVKKGARDAPVNPVVMQKVLIGRGKPKRP